jgi:hypothetical protein
LVSAAQAFAINDELLALGGTGPVGKDVEHGLGFEGHEGA